MRPKLKAAIAAGVALAVVTACSGTSGRPEADNDGKGKVGGSITYTWWGATARNQKTEAVVDQYLKKHPKVKVQTETTDFGSYWQKRNVEAAAKNMPCVPQMQARELREYTSRNALMPLDAMVKAGTIDVSGIPKKVLATGKGEDGKLYMVPTGAAYDGIMYNTALARRAGVGAPAENWTWEQWSQWLTQASKKLPKGVYATSLDGGNADMFISYVESHGEQLFDEKGQLGFPRSMLTDYWAMWEKLRKEGATVPADQAAELGSDAAQDQTPIMQAKAMSQTTPGNWMGSSQDLIKAKNSGPVKMTTHPYGPRGLGNVLIASGLSISANCDNVPTAASFVDFFANDPKSAKIYASDNGAVTKTSLLRAQENDPKTDPSVKEGLEVYDHIVRSGAPNVLYPRGYTTVFDQAFYRTYQQISTGHSSVDKGTDDFFKHAKSELRE